MTGFILIDKPEGMTSFSAANRVKRILGVKKAGHTGTLDPMATGVLAIALSNSTRFIELLPSHDKAYIAKVRLGVTTDTLDITGNVLSTNEVNVSSETLSDAVNKFSGEIMQIPPMYSAKSKDGVRLYDLARQGIEVEREAVKITIHNIEFSSFTGTEFTLCVNCSAGTYIRSLCDDIGKELGCGAVMTELRRTAANGFSVDECISLSALEQAVSDNDYIKYIIPTDKCLAYFDEITVTNAQANRFHNGGSLMLSRLHDNLHTGLYRVYSPEKEFLGLGEIENGGDSLNVRKVFVND